MTGNYPLSLDTLSDTIKMFEDKQKEKLKEVAILRQHYDNMEVNNKDFDELYKIIPTWEKVFNEADKQTKRVLINKIVDKIIITNEKINVKFKIKLDYSPSQSDAEPILCSNNSTTPYTPCSK